MSFININSTNVSLQSSDYSARSIAKMQNCRCCGLICSLNLNYCWLLETIALAYKFGAQAEINRYTFYSDSIY